MTAEQDPNRESLALPDQRGIAIRSHMLVARGLHDVLARQARTVHFPADRSVGKFSLYEDESFAATCSKAER